MGILLDTIQIEINKTCTFKIRDARYDHDEQDSEIYKILNFRGDGEKKKFADILSEWHDKSERLCLDICSKNYPLEEHFTLYEYIVINNYHVIFGPNDIVLRYPNKAA